MSGISKKGIQSCDRREKFALRPLVKTNEQKNVDNTFG